MGDKVYPMEVSNDVSLILNMINTKLVLHKFPDDIEGS